MNGWYVRSGCHFSRDYTYFHTLSANKDSFEVGCVWRHLTYSKGTTTAACYQGLSPWAPKIYLLSVSVSTPISPLWGFTFQKVSSSVSPLCLFTKPGLRYGPQVGCDIRWMHVSKLTHGGFGDIEHEACLCNLWRLMVGRCDGTLVCLTLYIGAFSLILLCASSPCRSLTLGAHSWYKVPWIKQGDRRGQEDGLILNFAKTALILNACPCH